jgi:pantoate--beta-alanine ligase
MAALVQSIAGWNSVAAQIRSDEVVGFVPTMGALHKGHGALLKEARSRCSVVVASIFVNPIQFNQKSDYDLYPRVLADDVAFCTAHGVDYIFAPSDEEMYPEPQRVFVDVKEVSEHLCGQNRPGHFRGVATVVLKLFQIVQPRFAFFGEKDYQQLAVVRRLVRDLNIPIQVVGVPTVRESDGLAMSSRNRRLNLRERAFAPSLYKSLLATQRSIARGERNVAAIKEHAGQVLNRVPEIKIEYFDLVDPETIRPVDAVEGPVRVALAAWIGKTRLIDNVLCEPPRLPIEPHKNHSENRQAPTKIVDHVSLQDVGHLNRN